MFWMSLYEIRQERVCHVQSRAWHIARIALQQLYSQAVGLGSGEPLGRTCTATTPARLTKNARGEIAILKDEDLFAVEFHQETGVRREQVKQLLIGKVGGGWGGRHRAGRDWG